MGMVDTTTLPAVVAGTDANYELMEVPATESANALARLTLTPQNTQAAQGGTNYLILTVKQFRAGSAIATLGSLLFSVTATVAETPIAIPLTGADQQLQAGDVLEAEFTHAGTGGALGAGSSVEVELQ
jgi:hypothetical protein